MRKLSISLFLMVTALFLTSCGGDQELNLNNNISATVDGYIFDNETNLPIDGATVTISNKAAKTDANGYYRIGGLSTGDYCVKLEKEGYASYLNCSGAISTNGTDFYGDALQTSAMYEMLANDKSLELTFRYADVDNIGEYKDVSSGLEVMVQYTSTNLIDVFETFTTDSKGSITIENCAYSTINVMIDQKLGGDIYELNTNITGPTMKANDGSLRVEVLTYEEGTSSEIDVKL